MKFLDLVQNTTEWEEFRQTVLGASDIGILMEGTEREIYELLQVKRGNTKKYVTSAMQRGSDMEGEALEWLLGEGIREVQKLCALMDAPNDWLMASFDYFDEEKQTGAEIKCPVTVLDTVREHKNFKRWWWQIQAQMAVSGLNQWSLLVYGPCKQLLEKIDRDEEAIAKILEKGKNFHDLLMNFEDLPVPSDIEEREDFEAKDWADQYRIVDQKIKELEEEKKVLRDEGLAIANDVPFISNGVKVTRCVNKETIDYEAACKAHGIDASSFKKAPKTPYTWKILAS